MNPEQELEGKQLFENTKSGRNRAPVGGPAHGYDDHRAEHRRGYQRDLARRVARRVQELADGSKPALVVIAGPRMLGLIREELERHLDNGIELTELSGEHTRESLQELEALLDEAGLMRP